MTKPLLKFHHFLLVTLLVLLPGRLIAGSTAFQADNLSKDAVLTLPFEEDFSGVEVGEMPENWTRTHSNWAVANSNAAGGASAPELRFDYTPVNEGTIRAITPLLDATEVSETIKMEFMHRLDHFSGSYYLKVQTSLDGEEWDDQWVVEVGDKAMPELMLEQENKNDIPSSREAIYLEGIQEEQFYIAFVFEGNTDDIDRWYIDDISVSVAADMFGVEVVVLEDSEEKDPIANAEIHFDEETFTTDMDGVADIFLQEGVNYSFSVVAEGYVTEEFDFTMIGEDTSIEVLMTDVVLEPRNLRITTEDMEPGDALLTWTDYGEQYEYRYDDGNVTGQLGHQNGTLNSMHGSVYRNDALLHEMAWMLTNEGGPHNTVKLWVIGLDEDGFPDRDQVLYTAEEIENTDMQWMTYEFEEPVEAPNGFYIAVSYNGFLGLATDDGDTPGYEFQPETHFGIFNILDPSSQFSPIEQFEFTRNFMIRAYGENFGELEFDKKVESPGKMAENTRDPSPVFIPLDQPFYAGSPYQGGFATKALLGFNIYLNDELVATEVQETEYKFSELEGGTYTAGVQSIYTTTSSDIPSVEFEMDEGTFVSDLQNGDVVIYPNPASDRVVVQSDNQIISVSVIDLLGKVMVYTKAPANSGNYIELDVSDLNTGLYFIRLTTETGKETFRLQVTR